MPAAWDSLEPYEAARPSEELFRLCLSHGGDETPEPVPDDVARTLGSLLALLVVALQEWKEGKFIKSVSKTNTSGLGVNTQQAGAYSPFQLLTPLLESNERQISPPGSSSSRPSRHCGSCTPPSCRGSDAPEADSRSTSADPSCSGT
ncbi:hypothetical protein THAOC_17641 [Thalassiosira oceanica]|uniref:Uncharacterized protein n=1 Tax=Thalassiosira oceanica TaxID=159749 RepID=K0S935_THAOC|nr:hypothetical protein THAOC_17641 [Thalassiosira oceanica]|eukprot:EJK61805.1 hypothetical protein THAOC_17641 [Thalassiosira oceanica]